MRLRKLAPVLLLLSSLFAQKPAIPLPSSKVLLIPVPGAVQPVDNFPTTVAVSPDGRYMALLHAGYGTIPGGYRQGISVLDLETNKVVFFPDDRLGRSARQTFFEGLAFSSDGHALYASIGSLTDPEAKNAGSTGNGIAVYRFDAGHLAPERLISIPPQPLAAGKRRVRAMRAAPAGTAVPFPAGIATLGGKDGDQLLAADNLSDDVLLLRATDGKILRRFDLSTSEWIPASYPYAVVASRDGKRAWCSLWNASRVAELDLVGGGVRRWISLRPSASQTAPGSHPGALLLSRDDATLFVALANTDEVAEIATESGKVRRYLSTRLPGQRYLGGYPVALAITPDGRRLFAANSSSDSVAVFDLARAVGKTNPAAGGSGRRITPMAFIPTEWYPTALAVRGGELFTVSGKAQGTGPNAHQVDNPHGNNHPYIAALLHGSVARLNLRNTESHFQALTQEALRSNLMSGRSDHIVFHDGSRCGTAATDAPTGAKQAAGCKIKHVIYIIKENRTYDQVFGDLPIGDNDKSLVMYGAEVTPNHHKLATQFGVLDNFYDSGEVSGDGHVWSNAAIISDYTEKIWPINYRGKEREYDFEGRVMNETPLEQGIADVNEPGTGYLWANAARHGLSYRNYGEFVPTTWCDDMKETVSPLAGPPAPEFETHCPRRVLKKGEAVPANVGDTKGEPSLWPWDVPLPAYNRPTKPELRGHFNPQFASFRVDFPDQFRTDIFLRDFQQWVSERQAGRDAMPNLITMSLPNDHTGGTRPGYARPAASVADNDLALGRIVDAVSHSAYWEDTAILVLEDDAQNGADHVDAHRSIALVISKYAPAAQPAFVDHHFYTTVNMVRTIEVLLGLPPMNINDAQAALMAPLFSGAGDQAPYRADYTNRDSGLLYEVNPPKAPGAHASMEMDFSRPDAVNTPVLNGILWQDAKGSEPMPEPRHTMIRERALR